MRKLSFTTSLESELWWAEQHAVTSSWNGGDDTTH